MKERSHERRAFFERVYAPFWRVQLQSYGDLAAHRPLLDRWRAALPAPARVLDVSCGNGVPLGPTLAAAGPTVGADLTRTLLDEYRRAPGRTAALVQAEAAALPFPDGVFEGVFCWRASWYYPDLVAAVREFARVLARPGVLLADFHNADDPGHRRAHRRARRRVALVNLAARVLGRPQRRTVVAQRPTSFAAVDAVLRAHFDEVRYYETLAPGERELSSAAAARRARPLALATRAARGSSA